MMRKYEFLKPVWVEGTLLSQQHFQHWERYLEFRERVTRKMIQPLYCGWINYAIDKTSLALGTFRLTEAEGIFPNGEWFSLEMSGKEELSLSLEGEQVDNKIICLCIPKGKYVAGISGYKSRVEMEPSYRAEYVKIQDEYDPSREREVLIGISNMYLSIEDKEFELSKKSLCLPLAKLEATGVHSVNISKDYIPPLLRIAANQNLLDLMQEIKFVCQNRLEELSEKEGASKHLVLDDLKLKSILVGKILNNLVTFLEFYESHSHCHPEMLYFSLLKAVSNFQYLLYAKKTISENIIKYNHYQLFETFMPLYVELQNIIEIFSSHNPKSIKLYRQSETIYCTGQIESRDLETQSFFLKVTHHGTNYNWIEQFEREVKVAAKEDMDSVVSLALTGVEIKHSLRSPKNITVRTQGCEYFYLINKCKSWEKILKHRNIAVFVSLNFLKANLELLAIEDNP